LVVVVGGESFVKSLVDADVLTADDLRACDAGTSAAGTAAADPQELAKRLVRAGRLTKFQAAQALAGKARALVKGDYVILERIGAGGMGQVFKAQHRRMKRVVALKMLPSAALKDEQAIKRFQREVEAAAKLLHPNIVTAFDRQRLAIAQAKRRPPTPRGPAKRRRNIASRSERRFCSPRPK
jgi:serine/threonine-protein kinase